MPSDRGKNASQARPQRPSRRSSGSRAPTPTAAHKETSKQSTKSSSTFKGYTAHDGTSTEASNPNMNMSIPRKISKVDASQTDVTTSKKRKKNPSPTDTIKDDSKAHATRTRRRSSRTRRRSSRYLDAHSYEPPKFKSDRNESAEVDQEDQTSSPSQTSILLQRIRNETVRQLELAWMAQQELARLATVPSSNP